jgi:citrate synthase
MKPIGPDDLLKHVGRLKSRMGACYPGSHAVFRGHELHGELHRLDWVELYLFGITGRRFSPQQIELVHAIWVCTSYPDARLWNNRIAALAGSARSTANLGITAALAVSDATVYGGQAGARAMEFFLRAGTELSNGAELEAFVLAEKKARRIYGYGRPINSNDERIPWLMELARRHGFDKGKYVSLAFEVERILVARYPQLRMNYAALHAAFIADMGLSVREYQLLRVPTFLAGMPPGLIEAAENSEGTLFPTPCDGVAYEGMGKREWPQRKK